MLTNVIRSHREKKLLFANVPQKVGLARTLLDDPFAIPNRSFLKGFYLMYNNRLPSPLPVRGSVSCFSSLLQVLFAILIGVSCSAMAQSSKVGSAAVGPLAPLAPVISPAGGTYSTAQQVSISVATPGASVYYLINGGSPTPYTGPFTVSATSSVLAIGVTFGAGTYAAGPTTTQSYTIQAPSLPAAPVISPAGGTYASAQQITMSEATPGASIYYLMNGGSPIRYTGPFTVSATSSVLAIGVVFSGSSYTSGPTTTQSYTIQTQTAPRPSGTPTWTRLTSLPSLFSSAGGRLLNVGDGKIYGLTSSGSSPNVVTSVFVASQNNLASWTNITTPSLSQNGTEYPQYMGLMPNGTVLLSESNGSSVSDVFYWNGSTSSPQWAKVTGYDGSSSSHIYNFTNDSAGYTYFSPAWSGDIWRNDAPNSTNFTKVFTNLYSLVGSGNAGGLYQTFVWDLGDGRGDTLWTCGEGSLVNVDLSFTKVTQYLNAPGYSGNCFGLGRSANSILALRTADANGDMLTRISIPTRASTIVPSANPVAAPYYPAFMDTNLINGLQWVNGTQWMLNNSAHGTFSLLLSPDDGSTWQDITAGGGIDSSCTGSNLSAFATATPHSIIARCQGGTVFWQYGPI